MGFWRPSPEKVQLFVLGIYYTCFCQLIRTEDPPELRPALFPNLSRRANRAALARNPKVPRESSHQSLLQEGFDAGYVAGDVDTDCVVGCFDDVDAVAVLEQAQLFELFEPLEAAGG